MNSFLRFFSSVKLAIILIIILTIASIVGTLIPQHRSHEEYLLRYGELANLLEKIQLTKIYQSFWYLALLFLFALNLIICTLLRLPPKIKRIFRPNLHFQPSDITTLRLQQKLQLQAPFDSVRLNIQKVLKSRHYHLIEKKGDSGLALLARKKMAGLFGADVVHLAILFILIGGLTSGLFSFRADLALHEGEIAPVPQGGFSVRLDSFETEYYPSGQVKDWKSTLTVLEGEKEIISRTIEVNHPLNYKN
jgi:cytochrome c biogenesis protein